jgi:hypothetical protein
VPKISIHVLQHSGFPGNGRGSSLHGTSRQTGYPRLRLVIKTLEAAGTERVRDGSCLETSLASVGASIKRQSST